MDNSKRILFVRERWADGKQSNGVSDGDYMAPTLARHGMGEASFFYYDEHDPLVEPLDIAVQRAVGDYNPDIVMFSHLLSWGDRNIRKDTWDEIRRDGRKVIGIWHEGVASDVVRVADEHADCVDLNLFIDTTSQFKNYSKRPEKCFGLFDPRDPGRFTHGKVGNKTIEVFFAGTLVSRAIRCAGIGTLLANGVPVTKVGGRRELFIAEEQMIEGIQNAKVCLNFSDAGPYRHYKGRVAEITLCGSLLMEFQNDEILQVFEPYKEFVPFSDPKDLFEKTVHYLRSPEEREKIAAAGRAKALQRLDGREFWQKLFVRLEE